MQSSKALHSTTLKEKNTQAYSVHLHPHASKEPSSPAHRLRLEMLRRLEGKITFVRPLLSFLTPLLPPNQTRLVSQTLAPHPLHTILLSTLTHDRCSPHIQRYRKGGSPSVRLERQRIRSSQGQDLGVRHLCARKSSQLGRRECKTSKVEHEHEYQVVDAIRSEVTAVSMLTSPTPPGAPSTPTPPQVATVAKAEGEKFDWIPKYAASVVDGHSKTAAGQVKVA